MATVSEKHLAKQNLLTAEEFAELPDGDDHWELVKGEIVVVPPPSFQHGQICAQIARISGNHVASSDTGWVVSNDTGVVTERTPDSVRGADVAFYSYDAVPKDASPYPYAKNPPELVFEVKSPGNRWAEIDAKVSEYLGVGVQTVCVIDPDSRMAILHHAEKPPVSLKEDEELSFGELLAGFSVKLCDLLP